MKLLSSVLGQLARATKGAARTEDSDSNVEVPPILMPSILLPEPNVNFIQAPLATPFRKSFMQNDRVLFNASNSVVLCNLDPGLWLLKWQHHIQIQGGITDNTSSVFLEVGLVGADFGGGGPVATITAFSNIQTVFQSANGEFWALVAKDQQLQFIRTTVAGLGTATNRSQIHLVCHKLA